jgi:hypothetical protein
MYKADVRGIITGLAELGSLVVKISFGEQMI